MQSKFRPRPLPLSHEKDLKTLVENRSVYTLQHCELNVFETHQKSEKVKLIFDDMVLTTMLRGKKVMHLFGSEHFDYLPGESVIVPDKEEMIIDFPEANADNPTQCIALAVDPGMLNDTLGLLNEKYPKTEKSDSWNIDLSCFHLQNTSEITDTIDRLVHISTEKNFKAKDVIADFTLKELLIRLMQTQARALILDSYHKHTTTHRFAAVVQFIKTHIHEEITVDQLSSLCCMSRPNFFRCFKREFGISPVDFVLRERIKAARLLLNSGVSITQACYAVGINNLSYFFKLFKRIEGQTPNEFRKNLN